MSRVFVAGNNVKNVRGKNTAFIDIQGSSGDETSVYVGSNNASDIANGAKFASINLTGNPDTDGLRKEMEAAMKELSSTQTEQFEILLKEIQSEDKEKVSNAIHKLKQFAADLLQNSAAAITICNWISNLPVK